MDKRSIAGVTFRPVRFFEESIAIRSPSVTHFFNTDTNSQHFSNGLHECFHLPVCHHQYHHQPDL